MPIHSKQSKGVRRHENNLIEKEYDEKHIGDLRNVSVLFSGKGEVGGVQRVGMSAINFDIGFILYTREGSQRKYIKYFHEINYFEITPGVKIYPNRFNYKPCQNSKNLLMWRDK